MHVAPIGHLFEYDNKRAEPLAKWLFDVTEHDLASVADVGCGTRPLQPWLRKLRPDVEMSYFGVDVDPDAFETLGRMGLECIEPAAAASRSADVVIAYEVVEHIPRAEEDDFWAFLAGLTNDILVITTPNFEGFRDGIDPLPEYTEMRYVPDHFLDWDPDSDDPQAHKVSFTAPTLSQRIEATFGPAWDHLVYKAWRWTLVDHGAKALHEHHFKLHAVVWRRELYER